MKLGKLFIVEGGDYVGKTTFLETLMEVWVRDINPNAITRREPGGVNTGEIIRSCIMDCGPEVHPKTAAMLFFAARMECFTHEVLPALLSGKDVFLDRSYLTSLVYQGLLPDRKVGGNENSDFIRVLIDNTIRPLLDTHLIEPHHVLITAELSQVEERMMADRAGNSYDPTSLKEAKRRMDGYLTTVQHLPLGSVTIIPSKDINVMVSTAVSHLTKGKYRMKNGAAERVNDVLEILHD